MAGTRSTPQRERLRAEVEAAVADEIGRLGPAGISKRAVARRFEGRGVPLVTLDRWVDAALRDGSAGRRHAAEIKQAVAARAARASDPAADAAREAAAAVPVLPSLDEIAGARTTIDVIAGLQRCLRAAELVMNHATGPGCQVRNPRLLLQGAELHRRCLETSVRLNAALRDAAAVDRFHAALVAEVAKESPETAERITWRLQSMNRLFDEGGDGEFIPSS